MLKLQDEIKNDEIKEDNIATLIDMIDHKLLDKTYKTDDEEDKSIESQLSQMKKMLSHQQKGQLII